MLVIKCAVNCICFKALKVLYICVCVCTFICSLSCLCVCVCARCRCVDTAPCQRRFEASSVTVRAEANWVVGRLCLSALLDPVIHQEQSRARGTDHHLLQQVKNIEVTGKDLQPHAHAHVHLKKKKYPNCWRCGGKVCTCVGFGGVFEALQSLIGGLSTFWKWFTISSRILIFFQSSLQTWAFSGKIAQPWATHGKLFDMFQKKDILIFLDFTFIWCDERFCVSQERFKDEYRWCPIWWPNSKKITVHMTWYNIASCSHYLVISVIDKNFSKNCRVGEWGGLGVGAAGAVSSCAEWPKFMATWNKQSQNR